MGYISYIDVKSFLQTLEDVEAQELDIALDMLYGLIFIFHPNMVDAVLFQSINYNFSIEFYIGILTGSSKYRYLSSYKILRKHICHKIKVKDSKLDPEDILGGL